tara:strand:- start:18735 stop:19613 length:879 start_codon:yes stop_codon:yes gene_type:complete
MKKSPVRPTVKSASTIKPRAKPVVKTAQRTKAKAGRGETNGEALRYSAPALEKGLDIMEFLSERAKAYSLAQLGEEMGRTKGEIFRMLVVLESRGYVERAADSDDYQVTDKLLRIGLRRPQYRALTEVARPFMDRFALDTRYPCHLAIASDEQIVVIARAESPDLVGVTVRVGYRQPLLETGSGRIILAYMEGIQRRHVLAMLTRSNPRLDLKKLEQDSVAIRERGYLLEPSRIMEGVYDISCPVRGEGNEAIVAALTTPFVRLVTNRITKEQVAERLGEAAMAISARLSAL